MTTLLLLFTFASSHPNIVLALLFLGGQLLYMFKRAVMAVHNPKNPIASRRSYFRHNADVLVLRIVFAQIGCWIWLTYPDALVKLASALHVDWGFDIPKLPIVAVLCGLGSDVLLDWIATKVPALKNEIPQIDLLPAQAAPPAGDPNPANQANTL